MTIAEFNQVYPNTLKRLPGKGKRGHKYRAQPTTIDGQRFASKGEAERYLVLRNLATHGQIDDLRLQVAYPLKVNGQLICTYVADFVYTEHDRQIVEDYKGVRLPIYKLKAKLMKAIYGIIIHETGRQR